MTPSRFAPALVLAFLLAVAALAGAGDGDPPAPPAPQPVKPELKVDVVTKGEGRALASGDIALAHIRLALAGKDAALVDTRTEGDAQPIPVGGGRLIPGMEECVLRMKVGDRWKVRLPWQLGYGEAGYPGQVPPRADLDLEIEIVSLLEIRHEVVKEGSGCVPKPGDLLCVHEVGTLADGKEFESTRAKGEAAYVVVGVGKLMPGWELTLMKMRVGDRWKIRVPWQLAYGKDGLKGADGRPVVPGKTDVNFDIERLPLPEVETLEVVAKGEGVEVREGMSVQVHYVGTFADGKQFDSSRDKGQPFTFVAGGHQVIPGWDIVIQKMRVGDRWKVRIPWILAYGAQGSRGIPPRADLVFDIEVLTAK